MSFLAAKEELGNRGGWATQMASGTTGTSAGQGTAARMRVCLWWCVWCVGAGLCVLTGMGISVPVWSLPGSQNFPSCST